MGLVFLAEDPALNRQIAIKMLDVAADSEVDRDFLRTRLLRDARAAAILSHPNIVAVYDIVEEGPSVYVVMEYIEGESLAALLDRTPTPDTAFTLQVLRQMAAGLDYTHAKGIIHRDIKPGNVMVLPGGDIKILDFGIARMSDVRTSTPTGIVMGTVDYMAPEQIKAEAMDGRADQFSLAAVAYRMMSGSTLFGRHTLATLAYKLVNEAPPSVCLHNDAIPPAVDPVLAKALAKAPADRYSTCRDFVAALEGALSGVGSTTTVAMAGPLTPAGGTSQTTVKTAAAADSPSSKRSGMAAMIAGGVLLAAGVGGIAIWKPWVPAPSHSAPQPLQQAVQLPTQPIAPVVPPTENPKPMSTIEQAKAHPTIMVKKPEPKTEVVAKAVEIPYDPTPLVDTSRATEEERRGTPFQHGLEQLKAKDYQGAIESFTAVVGRRPRMGAAYFHRGFAFQMSGHADKAVEDFSEAIRLGHGDARTYANRGICEVRLHNDDAALSDFNRALELDPGYAGALNGRGGVLYRRQQYKLALRDFTAAIKANPEFVQAYENRAKTRRATGDPFGAADDLVIVKRLQQSK